MRPAFTLISAASTSASSVQVSDFKLICPLVPRVCLICGSCSSGQRFAFGFLQIPPREGHPCRSAIRFPLSGPFRTRRFLVAPVGGCALPGAQKKALFRVGEKCLNSFLDNVERPTGVEPASRAWEARVIPVYDGRISVIRRMYGGSRTCERRYYSRRPASRQDVTQSRGAAARRGLRHRLDPERMMPFRVQPGW